MSTRDLAAFAAGVGFDDLPAEALERTKELFLDWLGSALAGHAARPVRSLRRFVQTQGPTGGPAELLGTQRCTSPFFAALVNAAASHVVEQDDLHNASVTHPATVVFPAALAVAQALGSSGKEFITASVAGYEVCTRVGEFLGRSHYKVFHTTGTAGTLGAAAAAARLLGLDGAGMLHALGSAGTQAAGLWEFLRDAADSKQLHTAKAAANGVLAAYLAQDGFTGATRILEGAQGLGAGMSRDADPSKLVAGLGERWAVNETSIKFHASCRHTHPAADALLALVRSHDLAPADIARIRARVYQAAVDVLGPVTDPKGIHQSKFCMGFVLALIASKRRAGIEDFSDAALADPTLRELCRQVEMVVDPQIDTAYPQRWSAAVEVETRDGRRLEEHTDVPRGDPGNRLSRDELESKALRLAAWAGGATRDGMRAVVERIWRLEEEPAVGRLLAARGSSAANLCHHGEERAQG